MQVIFILLLFTTINVLYAQETYNLNYEKGRVGLVNEKGEEIIPAKYDYLDSVFYMNCIRAKKEDNWGILNKKGEIILPFEYSYIRPLFGGHKMDKDNVIMIQKAGFWGGANFEGKIILAPQYDEVYLITPNVLCFKKGNKFGLVNHLGMPHKEAIYNEIYENTGGTFVTSSYAKARILDDSGNILIDTLFDEIYTVSRQFYKIQQGRKIYEIGCGTVPRRDTLSILVLKNRKLGAYNMQGKEILPPQYDAIGHFAGGKAFVKKGEYWGLFNDKGEMLIPFELSSYSDDYFVNIYHFRQDVIAKRDGKYGYFDEYKNLLVPFEYDDLDFIPSKTFEGLIGRKNGKIYEFSDKGNCIRL